MERMMFGAPDADRTESSRVGEAQLSLAIILHVTGKRCYCRRGINALRNH